MLKATLRIYSYDTKNAFYILATHNTTILKTKNDYGERHVTILVKGYDELNTIVAALNEKCLCGVEVMKVKKRRFNI